MKNLITLLFTSTDKLIDMDNAAVLADIKAKQAALEVLIAALDENIAEYSAVNKRNEEVIRRALSVAN